MDNHDAQLRPESQLPEITHTEQEEEVVDGHIISNDVLEDRGVIILILRDD